MRIRKNNAQIYNSGSNKIVDSEQNSTSMSFLIPAADQTQKSKKVESKNTTATVTLSKITGMRKSCFQLACGAFFCNDAASLS